MRVRIHTAAIVIVSFLVSSQAFSQGTEPAMLEIFEHKDSILWTKVFDGRIDGIFPVEITLAFDGHKYAGIMHCGEEKVATSLRGYGVGRAFVLDEMDNSGKSIGELRGEIQNGTLVAQWQSVNNNREYAIRALDNQLIKIQQFQPVFRSLRGKETGIHLHLFFESPQAVSGVLETADGAFRIMGRCEKPVCENVELFVLEGKHQGNIINIFTESQGEIRIFGYPDENTFNELEEVVSYPLISYNYCSYSGLADYTVLRTGMENIDDSIIKQYAAWSDDVVGYLDTATARDLKVHWAIRASAWMDIFTCSSRWISGMHTFFDPHSGTYRSEPFAFDLDKDEAIALDQAVRDVSNLNSLLKDGSGSVIRAQNVVLTSNGIEFRSDFDGRTGYERTFIHYNSLPAGTIRKSFLKKYTEF